MINDGRLPLKEKFLEYFRKVPLQKYAGYSIGKDEDTITRWKKEDTDFADQIRLAKAAFLMQTVPNITDDKWKLERIFKNEFSQKIELGTPNDEKVSKLLDKIEKEVDHARVAREIEEQSVAVDTPVQDQGQRGEPNNVLPEPDATQTHEGPAG